MCDEEIEKQRSKRKMNKKTAESLVGVHTHTHTHTSLLVNKRKKLNIEKAHRLSILY